MKIKTIDINAKEWFDKANGNSYFSARITLNFGMKTQKDIAMPFQYGYGDHYIDMANDALDKAGYIKVLRHDNGVRVPLWQFCRDNNIILRTSKKENCLNREVKNWGKA